MKTISVLLSACSFFIISCKPQHKNDEKSNTDKFLNDLKAQQMADSFIEKRTKERYLDSTGMESSPIIVTSAKFVQNEYSNYKSIKLTYKNISDKKIQAIRFEWYGENSFSEPADMGNSLMAGTGGGFTENQIKPGQSNYGEWDILSKDGKKILMARAYEVVFDDGSKWSLKGK